MNEDDYWRGFKDGVNALQLFQKRYPDIAPASITALYDFIADKRRK